MLAPRIRLFINFMRATEPTFPMREIFSHRCEGNLWPGLGYPSAVALERVAVYLDADAGVLRDPHLALRHADCAAYKVLAEGVRGGVVLEHRLLRVHRQRRRGQGCHELQGGGEPYARAPNVRDDGGVPRLGESGYL